MDLIALVASANEEEVRIFYSRPTKSKGPRNAKAKRIVITARATVVANIAKGAELFAYCARAAVAAVAVTATIPVIIGRAKPPVI